jgi:tetratricopeptide (TPR) repeat protein
LGGLSFLAALICFPASAIGRQPQDTLAVIRDAAATAQKGDCKSALKTADGQIANSQFAGISDEMKLFIYRLGLACAWTEGQWDSALRYAEKATELPGADPQLWEARLQLLWQANKLEDVVTTIETMARDKPDVLNAIKFSTWGPVYRGFKRTPDLYRRFLKVISSPAYVPNEPGVSTDYFRKEYAVILAQSGDMSGAAANVALIDDPLVLKRISLDPRLRTIIPENFDARTWVERHMTRMREVAAAHTGAIAPQLSVANDLRMLNKGEKALATLDAIDPAGNGSENLQDRTEQLNWWWDSRAHAYALLGRYDEAVDAFAQGQKLNELNQPNISQTINLSDMQLRFGRAADALKTLEPIVAGKIPGSPYGLMQFHSNHGCASYKVGKIDDAKADLTYLRDHVADAPSALTSLQLCMGDIEGAAQSMIKRLETPDDSVEALLDLSDYATPPSTFPPYPTDPGIIALKARPDVQAAIARAGGTRKFNIAE